MAGLRSFMNPADGVVEAVLNIACYLSKHSGVQL